MCVLCLFDFWLRKGIYYCQHWRKKHRKKCSLWKPKTFALAKLAATAYTHFTHTHAPNTFAFDLDNIQYKAFLSPYICMFLLCGIPFTAYWLCALTHTMYICIYLKHLQKEDFFPFVEGRLLRSGVPFPFC